jgi:FecR protein
LLLNNNQLDFYCCLRIYMGRKTIMKNSFFIKTGVFAIALMISQLAFAGQAGTVTYKTGDVSITHADKTMTQAAKNDALNAGDTIETKDGRLQLALIDGSKVSLQPNTIYRINKYEFSGKEDGTEYGFTELIKGGLRTISGLIGHKNRERYQLKTAVATIGIRGTEFTVNFNDNNLLMTTNHGSVDVCNTGGCLNAMTGQSIEVAGVGVKPKPTGKKATAAAAPPASGKAVFAAGENVNVTSLFVATINTGTPPSAAAPSVIVANAATIDPITGATGITGTYTVGASNGVQAGSSSAPILVNGNNATALGSANAVNGYLTINFGTYLLNYNINVPTTSNGTFNLSGGGNLATAGTFASAGSVTHSGSGNPCNSGGATGCTGALASGNLIQGSLLGINAQQVGLQYGFNVPVYASNGNSGNGNGNGGPIASAAVYGSAVLQ